MTTKILHVDVGPAFLHLKWFVTIVSCIISDQITPPADPCIAKIVGTVIQYISLKYYNMGSQYNKMSKAIYGHLTTSQQIWKYLEQSLLEALPLGVHCPCWQTFFPKKHNVVELNYLFYQWQYYLWICSFLKIHRPSQTSVKEWQTSLHCQFHPKFTTKSLTHWIVLTMTMWIIGYIR